MKPSRVLSWICKGTAIFALAAPSFAFANSDDPGTLAGTLIENTASASYQDGEAVRTLNSNTVVLKVDELLDVTNTSTDPGPIGVAPGTAVLHFEVTNTGNGPEAYRLSANPEIAGNDFDAEINGIAIDSNGNGQYDPGIDTLLTGPETTDLLAPDQTVTVFVILDIPLGLEDKQESDVELTATAVTGTGAPGTSYDGQGEEGGDAVVGSTGALSPARGSLLAGIASVRLSKSSSVLDPYGSSSPIEGAIISYTLVAAVSGTGSVDDLEISDAIPEGTTYVAGSLALNTNPLTDASGDDAGQAGDSGIRVDLGSVPTGTNHEVTFDVTIN